MSFADELRGISQSNEGKPTIHDQMMAEAEQNFPRFVELIYTYLKGQCLIYANNGKTWIPKMNLSSFINQVRSSNPAIPSISYCIYEEGKSRPYTPEERKIVEMVRQHLGEEVRDRHDQYYYCLQERYAASLVSEITARFQAEELHAEAVPVPFGGVHGMCFDVHLSIKWQRFNPSEEYKRRELPV